jgi:hypothetical protein
MDLVINYVPSTNNIIVSITRSKAGAIKRVVDGREKVELKIFHTNHYSHLT